MRNLREVYISFYEIYHFMRFEDKKYLI